MIAMVFGLMSLIWAPGSVAEEVFKNDPEAWIDEDRDFDEYTWKEQKVPLPPYPREEDWLEVPESAANKAFKIYIDEKHLSVTPDDVIHYTVVLVSRSGSRNVFFEGLRCDEAQYKVYGYGTSAGKVIKVKKPKWKLVASSRRQDYRSRFQEHYMCGRYGQTEVPETILYRLEHDEASESDGARILGGDNVGW